MTQQRKQNGITQRSVIKKKGQIEFQSSRVQTRWQ
jgi:hypothetical protein